jgi:hypothetical protein
LLVPRASPWARGFQPVGLSDNNHDKALTASGEDMLPQTTTTRKHGTQKQAGIDVDAFLKA